MCILLLPLLVFLSSLLTLAAVAFFAARKASKEKMAALLLEKVDSASLAALVDNRAVEELLDVKLDSLVLLFKQQIPMASTFLVGSLVSNLKGKAHTELMGMVPELAGKLLDKEKLAAALAEKLSLAPIFWRLLPIALIAAGAISLVITTLVLLFEKA